MSFKKHKLLSNKTKLNSYLFLHSCP